MSVQRIILIISDDIVTRALANEIVRGIPSERLLIAVDRTVSPKKVLRLLAKNRIKPAWLVQQAIARFKQRQHVEHGSLCQVNAIIEKPDNLRTLLDQSPDISVLLAFRAGILVGRDIINRIDCYNAHYARLPDYPGLGSIAHALANKDYQQEASLHRMEPRIDAGQTVMIEPFDMMPSLPYWKNELIGAEAGARVARRFLLECLDLSFAQAGDSGVGSHSGQPS